MDEAGRALEAQLMSDNEVEPLQNKGNDMNDVFRFTDGDDSVDHVGRESANSEGKREKKKKKKRAKDEHKHHKHHHHHHGSASSASSSLLSPNEEKEKIPDPEIVKCKVPQGKPSPSLPCLLDENSQSKTLVTPSVVPPTTPINVLKTQIVNQKAVSSIEPLKPTKSEPEPEQEVKTPAKVEEKVEEKSRVVISQEETEDAVKALLGENFGIQEDYSDCYEEPIVEEPVEAPKNDEAVILPEEDEEMKKAIQSLNNEELDIKPDTPQSENDLQIDTDPEEEDENTVRLRFDNPPKTPDVDLEEVAKAQKLKSDANKLACDALKIIQATPVKSIPSTSSSVIINQPKVDVPQKVNNVNHISKPTTIVKIDKIEKPEIAKIPITPGKSVPIVINSTQHKPTHIIQGHRQFYINNNMQPPSISIPQDPHIQHNNHPMSPRAPNVQSPRMQIISQVSPRPQLSPGQLPGQIIIQQKQHLVPGQRIHLQQSPKMVVTPSTQHVLHGHKIIGVKKENNKTILIQQPHYTTQQSNQQPNIAQQQQPQKVIYNSVPNKLPEAQNVQIIHKYGPKIEPKPPQQIIVQHKPQNLPSYVVKEVSVAPPTTVSFVQHAQNVQQTVPTISKILPIEMKPKEIVKELKPDGKEAIVVDHTKDWQTNTSSVIKKTDTFAEDPKKMVKVEKPEVGLKKLEHVLENKVNLKILIIVTFFQPYLFLAINIRAYRKET